MKEIKHWRSIILINRLEILVKNLESILNLNFMVIIYHLYYLENVRHYTKTIDKSQNMTTQQKLNNLDNIRTKLSKGFRKENFSGNRSHEGAKHLMNDRITKIEK
jgi:hypothetical protein